MKWEIIQVTDASVTFRRGYKTLGEVAFSGTPGEARAEIERRATATGLKCFATRMDGRPGRTHLPLVHGGHDLTSHAGTI